MRAFVFVCIAGLACLALTQESAVSSGTSSKPGYERQSSSSPTDLTLKDIFEGKIKTEWEALRNKDKKSYTELLADDYEGVEVDGRGERNKIQAVNELGDTNVYNYTLFGFKVISLGPDAALVVYESTMQFPPRAQVRYSRVYISEIWVKRSGQWKELHYQETHVK